MVVLDGNYCPATGKECFDTKGNAQKAMKRLDKKGSKKGAVYFCPDCNKWHITHYGYNKSKDVRQNKIKNNMAGKGKFKIGAEVGYIDNLGSPLKCGDYVRHIVTGKEGVISQYGVVKGEDGTNYKLCDNFWEVIESPFKAQPEQEEPINLNIGEIESEAHEMIGESKEKTLMDFSDDDLLAEVLRRGFSVKTLAEHGIKTFGLPEMEDTALASELRKRGYEVTAEKTVKISL